MRKIKKGAQPSRQRHTDDILASTASVNRRHGSAIAGFIPTGPHPSIALEIAAHIGPFFRTLNAELPVRPQRAIRGVSQNAILSTSHRYKATRHLTKVRLELEPHRAKLNAITPERSPARLLNIPSAPHTRGRAISRVFGNETHRAKGWGASGSCNFGEQISVCLDELFACPQAGFNFLPPPSSPGGERSVNYTKRVRSPCALQAHHFATNITPIELSMQQHLKTPLAIGQDGCVRGSEQLRTRPIRNLYVAVATLPTG